MTWSDTRERLIVTFASTVLIVVMLGALGAVAGADGWPVIRQATACTAVFVAPLAAFAVVDRVIGRRDARRHKTAASDDADRRM